MMVFIMTGDQMMTTKKIMLITHATELEYGLKQMA